MPRTGLKLALAPNQQWNRVGGKGLIEDICHFTFMLELGCGQTKAAVTPLIIQVYVEDLYMRKTGLSRSLKWTSPIDPCVEHSLRQERVHLCKGGINSSTKLRFPLPKSSHPDLLPGHGSHTTGLMVSSAPPFGANARLNRGYTCIVSDPCS